MLWNRLWSDTTPLMIVLRHEVRNGSFVPRGEVVASPLENGDYRHITGRGDDGGIVFGGEVSRMLLMSARGYYALDLWEQTLKRHRVSFNALSAEFRGHGFREGSGSAAATVIPDIATFIGASRLHDVDNAIREQLDAMVAAAA